MTSTRLLALGVSASAVLLCLTVRPDAARAQTREQIREQNEQLYQQQSGPTGFAPPLSGTASGAEDRPPASYSGDAGGATASSGGLTAQLLDRVQRLEGQVRTLQGRVDELEQALNTKTAALDKQIGDMNFQTQQARGSGNGGGEAIAAGAGALGAGAVAGEAAAPPPRTPAAPPPDTARTPEQSLKLGNSMIARHDYVGAEAAAQDAIANGHGMHAANAEFLLGQSYAGQRNYQQAAVAFYAAYNKSPRGPLAQDSLLRVGGAMLAVGQKGAACEALAKLHADFPKLQPNIAHSAAGVGQAAHC